MKILVTGGCGFIGSHIVDALSGSNLHEVDVYDNLSSGVNFAPYAHVGTFRPNYDVVIHCAAKADVRSNWASKANYDEVWDSTFELTQRVVREIGARVVFLSTSAVYREGQECREDCATFGSSPYAAAKISSEALLQSDTYNSAKPLHIFRLGCVVGERYHHGHITDFCRQLDTDGKLSPTSYGSPKRSYVHVRDVVGAVLMAVSGECDPGTYNVTSGVWCARDTARVLGVLQSTSWPENTTGWIGDQAIVMPAEKLRSQGWRPTHSIENGVREAIAHNRIRSAA